MTIIGIDLGTTNSACGVWTEDGVKLIPNRLGHVLTPSVVGLDKNGEVIVGRAARQRLINHSNRTVAAFKRLMGTSHQVFLDRQSFTAIELSSLVLRSLKEDAEAYLQEPVNQAVISVPAYFNDNQRQATRQAAELAGLQVARLINEPTAAAVAYGLHDRKEGMFLILDLGGGTFDVSLLEFFDGVMEVHASAGDNYLGGEDFVDAMVADVLREHGIRKEDLAPEKLQNLYLQMEGAKRKLGPADQTLTLDLGNKTVDHVVTNDWFMQVGTPLLLKAKQPIERTLRDANVGQGSIDDVVLVGGSTRLAAFRSMVGRMFGRLPSCHLDPDTVVAVGAAIQAGMLMRGEGLDDVVLTDVCPFTLGTSVVKDHSADNGVRFLPMIERNCVVPISIVRRVYTVHDNQNMVDVDIYQGESRDVSKNVFLGKLSVPVPRGPKGTEALDIRYSYDMNGLLEVDVTVVTTGATHYKLIENAPGSLTDQEKQQALEKLSKLKVHPRDGEENRVLMARAERLYESSLGDQREHIGDLLNKFESILDRQDPLEIAKYRARFEELLNQLESGDWF
ncbi:molecular chaperone HscC [Marinobacter zhejiangensis]|uniref:Molecular chaperone HscC n=1 Tax=Marinobacter zhejiangensis TaxID=488535 RepID=A0A1I4P1T1_9GAMM|nr:molecular chaperone HscC [Marinobacter zhejiangensis]SFM21606.1 molecular chaperone HscC [Marinobacter zhejiangensis]